MALIAGTDTVKEMMKNRILILTNPSMEIDWMELTNGLTGMYHIRSIDLKRLYQLWFEHATDIQIFEQNLFVSKLADKAFVEEETK